MKKMSRFLIYLQILVFAVSSASPAWAGLYTQDGKVSSWSYDDGPSRNDKMGKELIDLIATQPYMPKFSEELLGSDKFRKIFGPTWWRMLNQPKNSMKILFIGQDATHIAEAAERTATAGFGGRAQDLARYFGVSEGSGYINWSAFTIRGQYGSFETPYFEKKGSNTEVNYAGFVDNDLWLMGQDQDSPMVKTRNALIDWIIRQHSESLRMIVLFGGAARDAAATFVEAKGGKVGTRLSAQDFKNIHVPLVREEFAGGNNMFPVPLDKNGKDYYQVLNGGSKIDYEKAQSGSAPGQEKAKSLLQSNIAKALKELAFSNGGVEGSGVLHPAQLGGYDLRKMEINGVRTLSIKGLKLSDGSHIKNDVLVTQLPHPSALSRLTKQQASEQVGRALQALKPYVEKGWEIKADDSLKEQGNLFQQNKPYEYSRTEIGPEFYDFGTPRPRMVAVSDASRMSGKAHVIVFGTRDRVKFNEAKIQEMTDAKPAKMPQASEIYTTRPRSAGSRYSFDPGPGEQYARLIKENLNFREIYKSKSGSTQEQEEESVPDEDDDGSELAESQAKSPITDFNIKTHPRIGDFGHYRGTFSAPKVVVLADPQGVDDLITARALTGTRGQYLQGLMEDLGVVDQYLVIKTVPFGMDGATQEEWSEVLKDTVEYREKLISTVLAENNGQVKFILADGAQAAREAKRIVGNRLPVITIARTQDGANNSGLDKIAEQLKKVKGFETAKISGRIADIPRSHLPYYTRVWQGTGGDRVIDASDANRGKAFAEVAPKWAWTQNLNLNTSEKRDLENLTGKLREAGMRLPKESVPDFIQRRSQVKRASGF